MCDKPRFSVSYESRFSENADDIILWLLAVLLAHLSEIRRIASTKIVTENASGKLSHN